MSGFFGLGRHRGRGKVHNRAEWRRSRPALESLEGRELLSLTQLSPNAGFPYTTGVELQITYPDGRHFVGSGVLVDSYHVLTAGHVIYDASEGGFATSIIATPELNGSTGRFGSASATYETTYNTWINYSKAHPGLTAPGDMDIALIALNKNIGNSTGSLSYGYDNNNSQFAPGTIFNTFGYPAAGGYSGQYEEFSSGQIAGLSSDGSAIEFYQNQITIFGGSSGSPLYAYFPSSGQRVVYGIVVGGNGTPTSENFATRITQGIFNDIGSWISRDNGVRRPTNTAPALGGSDASTVSLAVVPPATNPPVAPAVQALIPLVGLPGDLKVTVGLDVPTMKKVNTFVA
jgi:V8-like Glu-specific endopeptidase